MPFDRPTLIQLAERIQGDIDGRLPGTDPRLREGLLRVVARMEAGVVHGLYGSLDWLAINLLPNTKDETILALWAEVYGVPRLAATAAGGPVALTGDVGAVVPAGTALQSGDGVLYQLDADVTLGDGTGTGTVTAEEAGSDGNQAEGVTLTLVSPVSGVDSNAVVGTGGLVGGADIEAVNAWSERLLQRIQKPPVGGARHDYERWAREAHPAVTHAWVTAHEGGKQGVVTVRIATYDDPAGDLPDSSSPILQTVYDYIDERRPVAGGLEVFAPLPQTVNMTLAIRPDTVAVRQAAEDAIQELFRREARPGAFIAGQGELAGTIPLSHVHEALSLVEDETDHQIQTTDALAPSTTGYMLVLGTITWAAWQ